MRLTEEIVGLALMRRIARALERANEIAQYRCDREFPPDVKPGKGERRGIVVSSLREGMSSAERKDVFDYIRELEEHR